MRPFDRSIEVQFPLRDVAHGALIVAHLRSGGVIGSGREIHVVMARSTRHACRLGQICRRLRRARVLRVAHLAAPHVGGVHDSRVVVDALVIPDDLVRLSPHHARKIFAHVDLVNHHREDRPCCRCRDRSSAASGTGCTTRRPGVSRRAMPSWSWHRSQLCVRITSRVVVTADPLGTKLNVALA